MSKSALKGYPRDSPEYVVAHAKWQRSRGRRPSVAYGSVRNPKQALSLARVFASDSPLTERRVQEIFVNCLVRDSERHMACVIGEGVMNLYAFHPTRLASYRREIVEMLAELPEAFNEPEGASFLGGVLDRHDHMWTSLHQTVDALFTLAIALNLATFTLPRDQWWLLRESMPFITIK